MAAASALTIPPYTGLQLRALRVARGIRAADIARVIGTSDRTIRSREREARPPRRFVEKYIDAVVELDPEFRS